MKLRAHFRVRNAAVIDARRRLGLSQTALAKAIGLPPAAVMAVERLDFSRPKAVDEAADIAAALGIHEDDVLPAALVGVAFPSDRSEVRTMTPEQIDGARCAALPQPREAGSGDTDAVLRAALERLNPLDRDVVCSVLGLFGRRAETLDSVAVRLGVGRERVRQRYMRSVHRLSTGALRRMMADRLGESIDGLDDADERLWNIHKTRKMLET